MEQEKTATDLRWNLIVLVISASNEKSREDERGEWFKVISRLVWEERELWDEQVGDAILTAIDLSLTFVNYNREFLENFIKETEADKWKSFRTAMRWAILQSLLTTGTR